MNPRLRQTLIACAAALAAVWIGVDLALGSFLWPSLALGVTLAAIAVRLLRLPVDVVVLGLVLFGYLVGNRGFAQLMPSPNVPLLPGEAALLIAGGWALVACSFERRLPWLNDPLHLCILAWLVVGVARVLFDLRAHGFEALRDFATIYYAIFFFIVQRVESQPAVRRYLMACLLAGCVLLPPLSALYQWAPSFFHRYLAVNGVPVLLYKGDLVYTFQAVAAVLLFHWAKGRHRYWAWPYAVVLFLGVMASDSRASMLGSVVVLGLLAFARRWRYPAVQAAAVVLAFGAALAVATLFDTSWVRQRLDTTRGHLLSIASPVRSSGDSANDNVYKWDNNRFRLVWWRSVISETVQSNPVFGLGFGYDLARGFLREYDPIMSEDFTARSPHCIALTAFGRMGAAGLAVWLGLCGCVVAGAWRSLRTDSDPVCWGLWCGVLVVLVSAHLGVVLEGPMGAIPFWIALGLAHAMGTDRTTAPALPASVPAPKKPAALFLAGQPVGVPPSDSDGILRPPPSRPGSDIRR